MFSGLVYAFVGIRFKWLHASLSAASLGALSVALLILHVSSYPFLYCGFVYNAMGALGMLNPSSLQILPPAMPSRVHTLLPLS